MKNSGLTLKGKRKSSAKMISQSMDASLRLWKPDTQQFQHFVSALSRYIAQLPNLEDKNEEESKKHLAKLFESAYLAYDGQPYGVSPTGRTDLAIKDTTHQTLEVLIECKRLNERVDFPINEHLNVKAFHQLVYYYLKETLANKVVSIKSLIMTNGKAFYLFDARTFRECFGSAKNPQLKKAFEDWGANQLSTTECYGHIKHYLNEQANEINDKLCYTYFTTEELQGELNTYQNNPQPSSLLTTVFKLLSPEGLMRVPLANTGNVLNSAFYNELLHIIGLEETKEGGKKVIKRRKNKYQNAPLIENILHQKESRFTSYKNNGTLEDTAIQLVITWVNRILFLKLLEARLKSYHDNKDQYSFLNKNILTDWDDLNLLFFQVLAKRENERNTDDRLVKRLSHVPYLNSSLFEETELEKAIGSINSLGETALTIHPKTVLKGSNGKPLTGEMTNLAYLLDFLDAYDFGSSPIENQAESGKLISASVLGLVFEKINGYKEGSFYTPSSITMYMCRESIRSLVLPRFNEAFGWECNTWEALVEACEDLKKPDLLKANELINSLKIADPAVGSGHFLVSALNELLVIKSELGILLDGEHKLLARDIELSVFNDELYVTDQRNADASFTYKAEVDALGNRRVAQWSSVVQQTIFNEKRILIENCLYGVDINPNSVQICQLRLWIELLKHTYYRPEDGFKTLETLPNIDINIKQGNSLISQFELGNSIFSTPKEKVVLKNFKALTAEYKNSTTLRKIEIKNELDTNLTNINSYGYRSTSEGKRQKDITETVAHINEIELVLNNPLFKAMAHEIRGKSVGGFSIASEKEKLRTLKDKLSKLEAQTDFSQSSFANKFEWRFRFPEVLNAESGTFSGFDLVIGNPPYMRVQEIQKISPIEKQFYDTKYIVAKGNYELANLFYELGTKLLNPKGILAYIMPHKFLNTDNGTALRQYLMTERVLKQVLHFGANMIFDSADTYTAIVISQGKQANKQTGFTFYKTPFSKKFIDTFDTETFKFNEATYEDIKANAQAYGSDEWILFNSPQEHTLFRKLYKGSQRVDMLFDNMFVGLQTSADDLYILHDCTFERDMLQGTRKAGKIGSNNIFDMASYTLEPMFFKPFLMGKDVHRYETLKTDKYVFFPYHLKDGKALPVTLRELESYYPLTYDYVMQNEAHFKAREGGKAGKNPHWFGYMRIQNLAKFEQPKLSSMEICTSEANVTLNYSNLYHTTMVYSWVKKISCAFSYEYLLSYLNSALFWWFLLSTGDTLQGNSRRIKTNYVYPYPIPQQVSKADELLLESLVQQVMEAKKYDYKADTKALEHDIDQIVYSLYNLTPDEIAIIKSTTHKSKPPTL